MNSSAVDIAAGTTDQIGLDVAREMRRRWRRGERTGAEAFFSRCPELFRQPEAAVELIYEEYCLRQSEGEQGVEQDIFRRFPQWERPLRVMLDCHHRLLESERDRPRFPEVGERVGEFRLLAELFRGPRGRVFVAEQTALAGRQVVLKVTALDGSEHLSLARLQHTHIVPLYSASDDAARNVRILCMPYFGRATLASLLERLAAKSAAARSGRDVIEAIDAIDQVVEAKSRRDPDEASAARHALLLASYPQAMCWITACLADALQFAHERGLVHLDLKPSNVLLAADGQPMLLDFHLAREPLGANAAAPENFGGTPVYMPPEQRAAMRSLREGTPLEVTVDGQADLFALGAMLYEALGGTLPVTEHSPPLERLNPRVSPGLSDMVARCLAPRPQDRYGDAAALAADLRRHLADEPLAGVPNRSVTERWNKWRRRRPGTLRAALTLAFVATAAAILLAGGWSNERERRRQAEVALADGERQIADRHFADAVRSFERGVALTSGAPFEGGIGRRLNDRLAAARRLDLARQLHQVADEVRVLYGAQSIPSDQLAALDSECRALWQRRNELTQVLVPALDETPAFDLRDIAIFHSTLQATAPSAVTPPESSGGGPISGDSATAHRAALQILDEAEDAFGPSAVLEHERQIHRRALGKPQETAAAPPPRTTWEHYALGRALLASGDLPRASDELNAALRLEPGGHWTNFYAGQCAYRTGRFEDAVAAFSVCIGTAPDAAACYVNRAVAYAALGRREPALRDCDHALRLEPGDEQARSVRKTLVE